MKKCIACGELNVDPADPPRYDVLSDGYDPDDPNDRRGPYCHDCFQLTDTGKVAE